jgi:hypothetical protein
VDIKKSSNHATNIHVPTVLIDMKLLNTPNKVDMMPDISNVQFEMSKPALNTLLNGLTKIEQQLSNLK